MLVSVVYANYLLGRGFVISVPASVPGWYLVGIVGMDGFAEQLESQSRWMRF